MNTLFIDTCSLSLNIACITEGSIYRKYSKLNKQTEYLPIYISSILRDSNLEIRDVNRVCLIQGSGAFTGMRMAISFAIGVNLVDQVQILGFDFSSALAKTAFYYSGNKNIIIILKDDILHYKVYSFVVINSKCQEIRQPYSIKISALNNFYKLMYKYWYIITACNQEKFIAPNLDYKIYSFSINPIVLIDEMNSTKRNTLWI